MIIGVGGLTSEVGKTTLLCELLRAFPGWEAIKTTRGHYRSCGKDPHTCCVGDLLETEPVVRSGRELTYSPGKDTGRYWDAGAVNVHWVIATDEQVRAGIKNAVDRVQANGVFIEGNSFTQYIDTDFFLMVARPDDLRIKTTARRALGRVSAFYLSREVGLGESEQFNALLQNNRPGEAESKLPFFSPRSLPAMIERIRQAVQSSTSSNHHNAELSTS